MAVLSPARRRGATVLIWAAVGLLIAVIASFAVGPLRLPPMEAWMEVRVSMTLGGFFASEIHFDHALIVLHFIHCAFG